MKAVQIITLFITMIAVFLCCFFIADARSATEEKTTEGKNMEEETAAESEGDVEGEKPAEAAKQDSEEKKTTAESEEDSKDGREIDFFTGGDNNLQSFNFMFELPFDEKPFKFEDIEGSLSGKSFMTFESDLSEDPSIWESLWEKYSTMKTVSRSYSLRVEGSPLRHLGGYIELESDYSIDTDPHLHFTIYAQYSPHTSVEVAVGGWGEVRRLWGEKETDEVKEVGKYGYGLRSHIDIEYETERLHFSMLIECLPNLSFDEYRVSASPEVEYKFNLFDKQFALVLHIEIDYFSEDERGVKIEPLTQLIRYRF